MKESILNGKSILAVDDEPDVLEVLAEELRASCPNCTFDQATSYEQACEKLASFTYDLLILDIMGIRGFDLLRRAVLKKLPVAMLTAHALTPDALERSYEMGARAYLPKEVLGEIIPYLEDVLAFEYLPGWKRLLTKLGRYFKARWGEDWQKTNHEFWKKFYKKTARIE